MKSQKNRSIVTGVLLILVGLGLYFGTVIEGAGQYVGILLGAAFLAAYFYKKAYGFLIPGCILLSIGIGYFGDRRLLSFDRENTIPLGLGFIAIFVIQLLYERKAHWWPLIPGGILVMIGFPTLWNKFWATFGDLMRSLQGKWPLVLVGIGILIILTALFGRGAKGED